MNFEQMQENLANWIQEGADRNGTWTIVEKKRQLNNACLEFVKRTKFLTDIHSAKTIDDVNEYPLPKDFMNGSEMVIDGLKYRRETRDKHFFITNGRKGNTSTPYRYYFIDPVKKTFTINPTASADDLQISFLYIKKPNTLVECDEESDIPEEFHDVPVYWAAYQMLPKEFEGNRRGRDALAGWDRGIATALETFNHQVDDNTATANWGPEFRTPGNGLGTIDFDNFGGISNS